MVKFSEITNNNIFDKDFNEITKNNKLSFSNNAKTAIIYGPNGTGKTSLVKVLSGIENTSVIFEYQKKQHKTPKDFFHIIDD